MSPFNRWQIITKLAPFHMPTLSKNDNNNINSDSVKIVVEYSDEVKLDDWGDC
jgi:hypothetical protein